MPLFSTSPSGTFGLYSGSKLLGERRVAENGGTWSVLRTVVMFHPKGESVFSRTSFVDVMLICPGSWILRELVGSREGGLPHRREELIAIPVPATRGQVARQRAASTSFSDRKS